MLLLRRVRLLFAVPMLWAQSWDPLAHFISLPSLSKKELYDYGHLFFKELPTIRHRDLGEALEQVHFYGSTLKKCLAVTDILTFDNL